MPLISDLPNGGAVQAGDLVLVSRGNQNVVLSGSQFANAAVAAQVQAALGNSGVVPGTYVIPALTIDATGRITSASNGNLAIPTKISDLTDDVGISLKSANAALTPGVYTNASITVGMNGQINLVETGTGGGGSSSGAVTLQPVAYSYYKLVVSKSRANQGVGFAGIQFRATAGGAATSVSSATASSTLNGYPISNTYDSDTSTFYTTGQGIPAGGVSLTFSLSQAINLKQISILPRQDGYPDEIPAEIMLYGSTDGLTYAALGIITPDALGATGSATAVTYAVSGIPSVVSGDGKLFAAGGTFEFDANGNQTFSDLQGCTVVRVGAGRYQVVFNSPLADANYGVLASGKWGAPDLAGSYQTPVVGMDRGYANATTTAGFYLVCETSAGGNLYDSRVFFVVYKNATALMQAGAAAATPVVTPRAARYWRVRCTSILGSNTAKTFGVGEIIFAKAAAGPQAAINGTAIASTTRTDGSYPPSAAFNGQIDAGYFAQSNMTTGQWIGYDFGSPVNIAEARLYSPVDGSDGPFEMANRFAIDFSDDKSLWYNVGLYDAATWADNVAQSFAIKAVSGTAPVSTASGFTGIIAMTPPKVADFPVVSEQYANPITATDDSDVGLSLVIIPVSGDKPSGILKALPATGDWQVEARIIPNTINVDYHSLGIAFTDSTTNYMHIMGHDMSSGGYRFQHNRYQRQSGGGYSGGQFGLTNNYANMQFIRIKYTASSQTNTVYISANGKLWRKIASFSDSTNGGKFNRVGLGFGVNYNAGNDPEVTEGFTVPHWNQSF